MSRGRMYLKMAAAGLSCVIGGPALMYYVTPSEGELFQRFSPELQTSNLANRARRQRDYEDFIGKLKEYSKSDKPIWEVAEEAQRRDREREMERMKESRADRDVGDRLDKERRRAEIREAATSQV